MRSFPDGFLWGAAASAHQVEGNNTNSDWWEWELSRKLTPSGQACRHYELFEQDFTLAASLHHNAHRFSVEWARIQPDEHSFSSSETEHYQRAGAFLRGLGMEPVVTLHHFTNPLWFAALSGWENKNAVKYFLEYVRHIVEAMSGSVRYWVTINEPLVYAFHGYSLGAWPPQQKSVARTRAVLRTLLKAHCEAYRLIHSIYKKKNLPAPRVSVAHNMLYFQPCCPASPFDRLTAAFRNHFINFGFLRSMIRCRAADFLGINYYTRHLIHVNPLRPRSFLSCSCSKHATLPKNSMGWEIYPRGLYALLMKMSALRLPIIILENGVCAEDDGVRRRFIKDHLSAIAEAIRDGAPVQGYFYWSLLDNFEWDKGFAPRFGIVEFDPVTFERRVKESAWTLARAASTGSVPAE